MRLPESVDDNLRFLIREVQQQLHRTELYLETPSEKLRRKLETRDAYIDNLRTFIQRACFKLAAEDTDVELLKSLDIIAINLERIADFCGNVVGQLDYVKEQELLTADRFLPFVQRVSEACELIERAITTQDVNTALRICRAEPALDDLYEAEFKRCLDGLRAGTSVETHVTLLFIWHYFERMGDSLLNIGEAIISSALGEKIRIGQLWALEGTLEAMTPGQRVEELQLKHLGESRSGCRIVSVSPRDRDGEESTSVIFKEGETGKLIEEKEGIERWEKVFPGVAPRMYAFHENGDHSAILLEHLDGVTFEKLLMQGDLLALEDGLERVTATLRELWSRSRVDDAMPSTFMTQLSKRLGDILAVHPRFAGSSKNLGGEQILTLRTLIDQAKAHELHVQAPFAVLNHGDCNVDNLIIVPGEPGLRVIDLHRSVPGDYVQDVSVFLLSNFRLQVFDSPVRKRIRHVMLRFVAFARQYADEIGDTTFEARLGFGLARSFATSTRFILDQTFAHSLMLRSRYLLERLVRHDPEHFDSFTVADEVLID